MRPSNPLWKEKLAGRMPPDWAAEIDRFETELELRRQDGLEERLFAETRLRRGAYGQRYDNGRRHDGQKVQTLAFPSGTVTKGPNTLWDAPGMQRIKVPYGGVNAEQLETMAELAEEFSQGLAHVTTRQDFQLHYVHLENTPTLMRRLAAVGITTQEACGNSVRNVTACPRAGVCGGEAFDITPYAQALARFLLGHPDCQDFGRKFKPAFSGCAGEACGLTNMHDLGVIAAVRQENGQQVRGLDLYVGGGLGAVPHQAKLLEAFLPPEELLPTTQAIARVYARLGEKKNRNRARIKFLLRDLGIDQFRELVRAERQTLPHDPRWTEYIEEAQQSKEVPLRKGSEPAPPGENTPYAQWFRTNVRSQRQTGYFTATVALPLGDIAAAQLRALADITRKFTHQTIRTTVEQNFLLRWVSGAALPELFADLQHAGLADPGAGTILDVVSCPGTDTCKLGISASRGLAGELRNRLAETAFDLDDAVRELHIKVSGCFNSCGQHHIADLGFYGVSRKVGGFPMPHFQIVLGGEWANNAGSFGLPVMALPSKNIPEVVTRIVGAFVAGREPGEKFQQFIQRIGKVKVKELLQDLATPPGEPVLRDFFKDWGDTRDFSIGDIGVGECAGEVVTAVEFGLGASERFAFEAQVELDQGHPETAGQKALEAMLQAASALLKTELPAPPTDPEGVAAEFRSRFYDTQKFFDPYAGGKFAHYLFTALKRNGKEHTAESAHHLIEEAQLFIEAAHGCYNRITA